MKNKKVVMFILFFVLFLLALDFIPIKIAKKLKDLKYSDDMYICEYVTATEGNWKSVAEGNPLLNDTIYLNVEGDSHFCDLKEISNIKLGNPVLNQYVFYGQTERREISEGIFFNWLQLTKWDIVYPVQRQSMRAFYTPKTYLTLYDFDWIKMFREIFVE